MLTWYWSQCVHDAGVNGTAILPGDTTDVYGVDDVDGYGNCYAATATFELLL